LARGFESHSTYARWDAQPAWKKSYKETQRYLFKVEPVDLADASLLSGLVEYFGQGAADGGGVAQLTATDIAVLCDGLVKHSRTYADIYRESRSRASGTAEP